MRGKFSCQNNQIESHSREKKLKEWVEYEPEQFPGLVYRLNSQWAVVLPFIPRKVVLTSAKREEDLKLAEETLKMELKTTVPLY